MLKKYLFENDKNVPTEEITVGSRYTYMEMDNI